MSRTLWIKGRRRAIKEYRPIRVGVCCKGCGWRSYRTISLCIDVQDDNPGWFDRLELNQRVKGVAAYPNCPKCKGEVVYTHTTGPI